MELHNTEIINHKENRVSVKDMNFISLCEQWITTIKIQI